jgi:hypothetical protein
MDGFRSERCRISSDRGLSRLLDAGHPPVQGCDQLVELTRKIARGYRHGFTTARRLSQRATFQISPHLPQRQ